jgi:hypothetical protein
MGVRFPSERAHYSTAADNRIAVAILIGVDPTLQPRRVSGDPAAGHRIVVAVVAVNEAGVGIRYAPILALVKDLQSNG